MKIRAIDCIVPVALATALPALAAGRTSTVSIPAGAVVAEAVADSALTLHGDQEGTVFRSLTVEGENRIHLDFERPELTVDLDPASAPGLAWGGPRDVLDRTVPDLTGPFLRDAAQVPSPYTPRPWLAAFATGPVATFATDLKGVKDWKLLVVDSRGSEVIDFSGKGTPPRQIPWDGRDRKNQWAAPGLTYSYVLESWDEAGNKRRFSGDGFTLRAYRTEGAKGPCFLASGQQWRDVESRPAAGPGALALEAASRINLSCGAATPVEIHATGRTFAIAEALGNSVADELAPLLPGGHARLVVTTAVEEGAPPAGVVMVATRGR